MTGTETTSGVARALRERALSLFRDDSAATTWSGHHRPFVAKSTPTVVGRSTGPCRPIVVRKSVPCARRGPSCLSADGSGEPSNASSKPWRLLNRSRRGWLRPTPTIRRCRCRTRPSTSPSFVQSRGALRKELHSCLRTGRAMRRAKAYTKGGVGQGQLANMVMISERPAEVKDRAVPGHWEGDLIFGKRMTTIGTLVERHSRYVILLKLPNGHGAEAVRKAMTKRILTLPAQLRRSSSVSTCPSLPIFPSALRGS
jgi:hypothetical protein